MREKWVLTRKGADYRHLAEALQVDPVIVRIMVNRGLKTEEEMRTYLYGDRESLHDPHLLKDADRAAEILKEKITSGKKIRVIGDYDIDGIMATYILTEGFARCGAQADSVIPDRVRDGYGINIRIIEEAGRDNVDTIVTCDNGIAAFEPIARAKELGMTVIVTDHHEVPYDIVDGVRRERKSEADAIVNPKQEADHYPFSGLCGGAVALKLIQILYEACGIPVEEADGFLEFAGFATIGDVMDLQGENRLLAKLGLRALNQTGNLGFRALIAQNELDESELKAYHVGFRLGPCLNASGRLETAQMSLRLLQSRETKDAVPLAIEVTNLNQQRKEMTEAAVLEAEREIGEKGYGSDRVLVIFLPDCHESLAGIVAGRLREHYNRPSLVITRGAEYAKGSARSIEAYSMYDELAKHAELFVKFGGHPMAAGFSLPEENISLLRQALNETCTLTEEELMPKLKIDVDMPIDYVREETIEQLSWLEPFGKANEKPVFAQRNVRILSLKVLGKKRNVLRVSLQSESGRKMDGIYFGEPADFADAVAEKYDRIVADELFVGTCRREICMHICYYPEINEWNGRRSIQLHLLSISP